MTCSGRAKRRTTNPVPFRAGPSCEKVPCTGLEWAILDSLHGRTPLVDQCHPCYQFLRTAVEQLGVYAFSCIAGRLKMPLS